MKIGWDIRNMNIRHHCAGSRQHYFKYCCSHSSMEARLGTRCRAERKHAIKYSLCPPSPSRGDLLVITPLFALSLTDLWSLVVASLSLDTVGLLQL